MVKHLVSVHKLDTEEAQNIAIRDKDEFNVSFNSIYVDLLLLVSRYCRWSRATATHHRPIPPTSKRSCRCLPHITIFFFAIIIGISTTLSFCQNIIRCGPSLTRP